MTVIPFPDDSSREDTTPFDRIRHTRRTNGHEYWSARDLMELMGYASWDKFRIPLRRAMKSAQNQGMDLGGVFHRSEKIPSDLGGRPREDYYVTRLGAYLIAMNGDPNKPEVAAAQAYFAIKTREAEVRQVASTPALPQSYAEALRELATKVEEAEAWKATALELQPSAAAWDELVVSEPEAVTLEDAWKLMKGAGIVIQKQDFFTALAINHWIYKRSQKSGWQPYADKEGKGCLERKLVSFSKKDGEVGQRVQTLVTNAGISEIMSMLRRVGK